MLHCKRAIQATKQDLMYCTIARHNIPYSEAEVCQECLRNNGKSKVEYTVTLVSLVLVENVLTIMLQLEGDTTHKQIACCSSHELWATEDIIHSAYLLDKQKGIQHLMTSANEMASATNSMLENFKVIVVDATGSCNFDATGCLHSGMEVSLTPIDLLCNPCRCFAIITVEAVCHLEMS